MDRMRERILEYNHLCKKYMPTINKGSKLQDMIHHESQDTLYFHMRKLEKKDSELVDQIIYQLVDTSAIISVP